MDSLFEFSRKVDCSRISKFDKANVEICSLRSVVYFVNNFDSSQPTSSYGISTYKVIWRCVYEYPQGTSHNIWNFSVSSNSNKSRRCYSVMVNTNTCYLYCPCCYCGTYYVFVSEATDLKSLDCYNADTILISPLCGKR